MIYIFFFDELVQIYRPNIDEIESPVVEVVEKLISEKWYMQSFTADISKLIEMVVLTYKLVSFSLNLFCPYNILYHDSK